MSCIISLKQNGVLYLAADSMVTKGDYICKEFDYSTKIFRSHTNPKVMFAIAGQIHFAQAVKNRLVVPENIEEEVNEEYILTNIVPRLRDLEYGETNEYTILFAYENKCWNIDKYGCVTEVGDTFVEGSLSLLAEGCLDALKDYDLLPETRIRKAMDIIINKCSTVEYPCAIINSLNEDVYVFDKIGKMQQIK